MKKKPLKELYKAIYAEQIIYEDAGFSLTEMPIEDGMSLFTVYDKNGKEVEEFEEVTLTDEERDDIKGTPVYDKFIDILSWASYNLYDDDDDFLDNYYYQSSLFDDKYPIVPKEKTPEEIAAEKEMVESLCKSDTIVFHQTDPTTVMLDPIYEGKGFDVYKGSEWRGPLSKESIHELIRRHDRIICLGHGTSGGLLSGIIGSEEVPLLKDKKIFSMWCYAATFWKKHGFSGHGILTSDNFPSEVWECKAACNATVSADWIYDNMVLAGKIAGKAMDIGWENPEAGCELFRKEYSEQSDIKTEDERKVVEFNTNSMQVV